MQGIERGSLALCQQSHSSHFSPTKCSHNFTQFWSFSAFPFPCQASTLFTGFLKEDVWAVFFNKHVALMMIFSGKGRVQTKGISTIFQFSLIKGNYFLYMLLLAIYFRDDPPFQPGHSNPEAADGQLSRSFPRVWAVCARHLCLSAAFLWDLDQLLVLHVSHCHHLQVWQSHVSLYKLSRVRFVLVKYSHRGLVNDRYYYNMNMKLFKYLFWISNISAVAVNQGKYARAREIIAGKVGIIARADIGHRSQLSLVW